MDSQVKTHFISSFSGVKCISYAGTITKLERNDVEIDGVSCLFSRFFG